MHSRVECGRALAEMTILIVCYLEHYKHDLDIDFTHFVVKMESNKVALILPLLQFEHVIYLWVSLQRQCVFKRGKVTRLVGLHNNILVNCIQTPQSI